MMKVTLKVGLTMKLLKYVSVRLCRDGTRQQTIN